MSTNCQKEIDCRLTIMFFCHPMLYGLKKTPWCWRYGYLHLLMLSFVVIFWLAICRWVKTMTKASMPLWLSRCAHELR